MKILWVFSSFEIGGAQRRFADLAGVMEGEWRHIVTSMIGRYDAKTLLPSGVQIDAHPINFQNGPFLSTANINAMKKALGDIAPDLLVTHNWGSIEWRIANREIKIPHVHIEDGFGPGGAEAAMTHRRSMARRVLFSRAGTGHERYAFIAPSQTMARIFEKSWGVEKARVNAIPNGVDTAAYQSVLSPEDRPGFVIGAIGALRPEKRFDRLLRVAAPVLKSDRVRLLILGDGPERGAISRLADALGVAAQVEFAGMVSDVAARLADMDVVVNTSDTEQMPLSLIEAMAAGKAIVATDVGDVAAMLSEENRDFVFATTEEAAMTTALRSLLDNSARARAIGKANAQKAASDYALDAMASRYAAVFEDVAGSD
ncbi:MAG: glycosyltransferase family 4 protein [Pseudomonadota bacterium]